jgi:hypothetical protein
VKCVICGYRADCPCELDNGVCWTCKFGGKRINNKIVDNYCNQTLENLQIIKNKLILKPSEKIRDYQLSVLNSQIKQFNENPCRFKQIIDQILVD